MAFKKICIILVNYIIFPKRHNIQSVLLGKIYIPSVFDDIDKYGYKE